MNLSLPSMGLAERIQVGFEANRLSETNTVANYGGVVLGFGAIGGSGAMPPIESNYTVIVKWNGKQESFELKASGK